MMIPSCNATPDGPMERAAKNLASTLATDRRFPANVFQGSWFTFFFFDPDLLFEPQFVERLRILLTTENGSAVCMRNLDIPTVEGRSGQGSLFLNRETTGETYLAKLQDTGPASGWLYRMDRYGCMSDVGKWCIYCERNNEIAVIAIRQGGVSVSALEKHLHALPIERAIEKPASYGLSAGGLPLDWLNRLLKEYATKGDPKRS